MNLKYIGCNVRFILRNTFFRTFAFLSTERLLSRPFRVYPFEGLRFSFFISVLTLLTLFVSGWRSTTTSNTNPTGPRRKSAIKRGGDGIKRGGDGSKTSAPRYGAHSGRPPRGFGGPATAGTSATLSSCSKGVASVTFFLSFLSFFLIFRLFSSNKT